MEMEVETGCGGGDRCGGTDRCRAINRCRGIDRYRGTDRDKREGERKRKQKRDGGAGRGGAGRIQKRDTTQRRGVAAEARETKGRKAIDWHDRRWRSVGLWIGRHGR
jgi:hypothetical protein